MAQLKQGPTLATIRMVEDTLKNAPESEVPLAELKRLLPKKVNHTMLVETVDYLVKSNKILIGPRGIVWTYTENPHLLKMVREAKKFENISEKRA